MMMMMIEYRTITLLVVLVAALATWAIVKPKPTSLDDPSWQCPTSARSSSWDCIKKQ
jgi:hypothetical protein